MSDSEFVLWYISKIYRFTGTEIKYKYMIDAEPFTLYRFIDEIKYSLNINKVNEKPIHEFITKWYDSVKYEAYAEILDFIKSKYKVSLGYRNWEITNFKGKKVTTKDIQADLKGKYDENFVKISVDQWFENEIINASESMILKFN